MISMKSISGASSISKYMTEQAATEYYAGERVPSEWGGNGAAHQGLKGEVTAKDLTEQLEGRVQEFNRNSGQRESTQLGVWRATEDHTFKVGEKIQFTKDDHNLKISKHTEGVVAAVNGSKLSIKGSDGSIKEVDTDKYKGVGTLQHRSGWDLTFAAPKSVSIEAEVWGKADVRKAHEEATREAMAFLEKVAAQTRAYGAYVQTGNMTYAMFSHATSRSADPQTHTHCIVANVTYVDGKAYSISNEKLMEYRMAADAIYKNNLANKLERLGYKPEFDKKGDFEITGYTKEMLEVFSKRSGDIQQALKEHGIDKSVASYDARQVATLSTRKSKEHIESSDVHRGRWQDEANANGVIRAGRDWKGTESQSHALTGQDVVASAIRHLTERESAFSEPDLWKFAAKFSEGRTDTKSIMDAVDKYMKSGDLIKRPDGMMTTKAAVDAEKWMHQEIQNGKNNHRRLMTEAEFNAQLQKFEKEKGFKLKGEQVNAAKMILMNSDKIKGIQGLAGTGKTTMLEFIKQAADSKNIQIIGFSNGGAQAEKMQMESNIFTSTTARFIIDYQKMLKDAALAKAALETYERNSGPFGAKPNMAQLAAGVKSGLVKREYDSQERVYYTDKFGNTWCSGLYDKTTEIKSANIIGLPLVGAKEVTFAITDKGVYRTGSGVINEIATDIKSAMRENAKERSGEQGAASKAAEFLAKKALSKSQHWEKVDGPLAAAVRAQAALQDEKKLRQELSGLKNQIAKVDGKDKNTILMMDEASMTDQREMNKVIEAAKSMGAQLTVSGDMNQHQAVGAGMALELMVKGGVMEVSKLTQITRQLTNSAKSAVKQIVDGNHSQAVKSLNTIEISPHQKAVVERYKAAGIDMKTSPEFKAEIKIAREKDNELVRSKLAEDYAKIQAKDIKTAGTVVGMKNGLIEIKLENGQTVNFNPAEFRGCRLDDAKGKQVAGEGAALPAGAKVTYTINGRDKWTVITASNEDRRALISEIRENLKAQGELQGGHKITAFQNVDLTNEQKTRAINFEKGMTIVFGADSKTYGVKRDDQMTITSVDSRTNTIKGINAEGKEIIFHPDKIKPENFDAFKRNEGREFANGDRITFGKNDNNIGVRNGQFGEIVKFDGKVMEIRMDRSKPDTPNKVIDTQAYKFMDHSYALTSHKVQGQDGGDSMLHINGNLGQSNGDRTAYVNMTRARNSSTVYTQNAPLASQLAGVEMKKESAIPQIQTEEKQPQAKESSKPQPAQQFKPINVAGEAIKSAMSKSPSSDKPQSSKIEVGGRAVQMALAKEKATKQQANEAVASTNRKIEREVASSKSVKDIEKSR